MAVAPAQRLASARLYLCTDARGARGDLAEFLDAVLSNGVDIVQLREKGLEAAEELELLDIVADAAERHGALFAVNDRADVAAGCRAPVLHVGQKDLPVALARRLVGDDVVLGMSTHDPAQLEKALADDDVGYFCVGPTWPTPTKPGRPAAGLGLVAHASAVAAGKPWFAIGGIDLTTLDQVLEQGATRVVVVRAITEAADPGAAAAELARRLPAPPSR